MMGTMLDGISPVEGSYNDDRARARVSNNRIEARFGKLPPERGRASKHHPEADHLYEFGNSVIADNPSDNRGS